ncbi:MULTISPECIES: hypothetical protein [Pseudomonas]|uniref:hypothetical protein n=1 Tax=Pseudomonas TaxID=286 RepID=UPI0018C8B61A|nr:hypothetical protein [Pseudomonas tolaasii]MBY8943997.1 hypothetical protein [Pseudomonas tolaasii]
MKLPGSKWTFAHPTISDALTEVLRQKPHMMAALIRGATIDTILSSYTFEGSPLIRDMLVIQTTLYELHRNWMLFHFLSCRSSEAVVVKAVEQFPNLLRRSDWQSDLTSNDPRIASARS